MKYSCTKIPSDLIKVGARMLRSGFASLAAGAVRWRGIARKIALNVSYPLASRDEALARWAYRRFHGVEPDLGAPRGLDEKICWLKIHDRRPLLTRMCCKLEARAVVRERGFGRLLKELYVVWERAEDIDLDVLPDQFALKATHGTQLNYFHLGEQAPNRSAIVEMAQRWLKTDLASRYGEWSYQNVKPMLLAEELLPRTAPHGLPELRVWCFGGEPRFIRWSYGFNRAQDSDDRFPFKSIHLDLDWNLLPFRDPRRARVDPPGRPDYLDELLAAARALSQDLPLVRMDFTDCGGRLYFGEFTLYPNAGRNLWDPPETDLTLGAMVDLPDPTSLR